jgi:uncharacterized membrane protein HdeD (DUF308 family)
MRADGETARYIHGLGTGVAIVIGLDLICLGALSIARVFERDRDAGARALSGVLGLLGVIGGIAVVRRPGDTLLVIVIAVGLWLFGSGGVEMINALASLGPRTLALLMGAFDVILALVILSWPKISLGTLAVLTGIAFIIRGTLMVHNGIQVRRAAAAV